MKAGGTAEHTVSLVRRCPSTIREAEGTHHRRPTPERTRSPTRPQCSRPGFSLVLSLVVACCPHSCVTYGHHSPSWHACQSPERHGVAREVREGVPWMEQIGRELACPTETRERRSFCQAYAERGTEHSRERFVSRGFRGQSQQSSDLLAHPQHRDR